MSASFASLPTAPDLILHNARIYTVDEARPWIEAVAIRKHRISAVGSNEDVLALADNATRIIDGKGRLVLPGLCDAHIHFYDWSIGLAEVQLADTTSKAEMLDLIAARAAETPPGQWIVGRGWNESRWGETAFPTAAELDAVTGDRPGLFSRSDMHGAVANSAALRAAGVDDNTPNPPGGLIERDAAGHATGVLKELAIGLVGRQIPNPSGATLDEAILAGQARLHQLGVTAIHDQRMKDEDDGPQARAAYQRLLARKQLKLRVNSNVAAHEIGCLTELGLHSGFGNDYLRLGHVKFFSDGSMGSRTARLLAPFEKLAEDEDDNLGIFITDPEDLAAGMTQAARLGWPVSVHAIGDGANRLVMDVFAEIQATLPPPRVPHRIEHVQIVDPADLPRMNEIGLTASVQPIHVTDDMDTADILLGERGATMYNFRTLLDSGAHLALGSDAPVSDPNPFLGMHAALTRQRHARMARGPWYGDERITMAEIVYGYTLGAAEAVGWADRIGSITPGKRADLIMLDRDLFALAEAGVSGDEIATTQVVLTIFDGEEV
ncbi:MAG: amidohydrolase [Caldilineaceae bacterium]|nr:amidohydrolase [Caldilineaceae bacterium]